MAPSIQRPKVWLTPTTRCRAVTLPRRETRWNLQECLKLPDRSQPLVGRSSPYCGNMWRTHCCLTIFFDCRYVKWKKIKLLEVEGGTCPIAPCWRRQRVNLHYNGRMLLVWHMYRIAWRPTDLAGYLRLCRCQSDVSVTLLVSRSVYSALSVCLVRSRKNPRITTVRTDHFSNIL